MDNGKMAKGKAKAVKSGKTAPSTKDTGPTTWQTVKEDLSKQAEMFMKASGLMIRPKERAYISTRTELPIQESGITISNMGTVIKNGRMVLNTKATISKG
jgi:hypothetical protein